jgi:uridine monophosphate synthetase
MDLERRQLAALLFSLGAIKFASKPGEFRLKLHETQPDAPLSPIYLMLRTDAHPTNPGPLTPEAMRMIAGLMLFKMTTLSFDHYVAIPEAGEPFADGLERLFASSPLAPTRLRLFKEQLEGGKRRISDRVEGQFQPGDKVLLIDDLITQADSKLEAIAALEAQGLVVEFVLVLVDRGQGGKEQLKQRGYELISVFALEELLTYYADEWLITGEQASKVRDYVAANRAV